VVSFNLSGREPGEVCFALDQVFDIAARGGLHCAPLAHRTMGTLETGTIRLSMGYFNTAEEIDQVLTALHTIALDKPLAARLA
jgi:selenocysteine lyase/cysteine desulfurase